MKTAAFVTVLGVITAGCAWADLGETRQAAEARYQESYGNSSHGGSPHATSNPVEFRHKHRVVLVWFEDGRSVAEMFLCPHGLRGEQVERLLARQAGSSLWSEVRSKAEYTQLWARKDNKALAWAIGAETEFAVFVAVERDHFADLSQELSFKAVATRAPDLWARLVKLASAPKRLNP